MVSKEIKLLILLLIAAILLSACSANQISQLPLFHPGGVMTQEKTSQPLIQTEVIVIGMLLLAAAVGLGSQRLHIPYTLGLVIVGFGLTIIGNIPTYHLISEIILALLVPRSFLKQRFISI